MSARVLLQQAQNLLEKVGCDAPRKDAELMLMKAWDISQTSLIIKMMDDVPDEVVAKFQAMLTRRLSREPLAYILGKKSFWKDEFIVSSDVLVPRPETEHLIEAVLRYCTNQQEQYAFADIGTGSGCIAISLAKEYPNSQVDAFDISGTALAMAKQNAQQLGVIERMSFVYSDLYQAIPEGHQYDVIVSNPPYVSKDEMLGLEPELKCEPRLALTDEATGLTLLDLLLQDAHKFLKPRGLLVLESGLCGMPRTPHTLVKLEDYRDLAGNFRGSVFRHHAHIGLHLR